MLACTTALTGCGGGDGFDGTEGGVEGTVIGLAPGLTVTLQNNATDTLVVAQDGRFGFPTDLLASASYDITVQTQPVGQTCFVVNGSGVLLPGGQASDVAVVCSSTSSISGTVSGLMAGTSVTLLANGVLLPVAVNGAFAFPSRLPAGTFFQVSVAVQPAGQTCSVQNGSGVVVTNVSAQVVVSCQ
jgi:hypothetical protein